MLLYHRLMILMGRMGQVLGRVALPNWPKARCVPYSMGRR
jgi:hypothetical protein